MLIKEDGIILKTSRSGETSKVFSFLGKRNGKIRLLAKGALGVRSPFRGALEPGNHVEVVYYFKEGRSRFYLKEVFIKSTAATNGVSLEGMASRLAALELLDQICFPASPDEALVDIAVEFFGCRPVTDPLFLFLAFEIQLLGSLGVLPDFSSCSVCGDDPDGGVYDPMEGACLCSRHKIVSAQTQPIDSKLLRLIEECLIKPLESLKEKQPDGTLRKDLGKTIHWTYTYHVQGYKLPQSLKLI